MLLEKRIFVARKKYLLLEEKKLLLEEKKLFFENNICGLRKKYLLLSFFETSKSDLVATQR